jgi:hypothetical protein
MAITLRKADLEPDNFEPNDKPARIPEDRVQLELDDRPPDEDVLFSSSPLTKAKSAAKPTNRRRARVHRAPILLYVLLFFGVAALSAGIVLAIL